MNSILILTNPLMSWKLGCRRGEKTDRVPVVVWILLILVCFLVVMAVLKMWIGIKPTVPHIPIGTEYKFPRRNYLFY